MFILQTLLIKIYNVIEGSIIGSIRFPSVVISIWFLVDTFIVFEIGWESEFCNLIIDKFLLHCSYPLKLTKLWFSQNTEIQIFARLF